jgi:antitoxin FitA
MATLTIRNLDEGLKRRLRIRGASNNRSMETEARAILQNALSTAEPGLGMASKIRNIVEPIGGIDLTLPDRQNDVSDRRLAEFSDEV